MLVSGTKGAVSLVCMVKVGFLYLESPHMVNKIIFRENCRTKVDLTTLELQEQPLSDPCESFEGFGDLN